MSWLKKNIRTDHDNYDLAHGPRNPRTVRLMSSMLRPESQRMTWQERLVQTNKEQEEKDRLNAVRLANIRARRMQYRLEYRTRAVVKGVLNQIALDRRIQQAEIEAMSNLFGVQS